MLPQNLILAKDPMRVFKVLRMIFTSLSRTSSSWVATITFPSELTMTAFSIFPFLVSFWSKSFQEYVILVK